MNNMYILAGSNSDAEKIILYIIVKIAFPHLQVLEKPLVIPLSLCHLE